MNRAEWQSLSETSKILEAAGYTKDARRLAAIVEQEVAQSSRFRDDSVWATLTSEANLSRAEDVLRDMQSRNMNAMQERKARHAEFRVYPKCSWRAGTINSPQLTEGSERHGSTDQSG